MRWGLTVLLALGLWLPALSQGLPAPSNLRASVPAGVDGITRIELRWDPVPGASGYEVLQFKGKDWWFDEDDPNRTPFTSSTTITGLTEDSPYEFVVRAVGPQGTKSPNSTSVGVRTASRGSVVSAATRPKPDTPRKPGVDPKAPAPDEPTGLFAVFSENDRVQLSWRKSQGASTYQIEEEVEGKWVPAQNIVGAPEANTVVILDHPLPGPWRFRVIAVASNGKRSEPSWPATAHRDY